MKKILYPFFILILGISLAGIVSCEKEEDENTNDDPPEKEWTIFVYGRPTCGYCAALKTDLDNESIPYIFYDVDNEPDKNSEMWAKLNEAGMAGGSVGLPVVDVMVDNVTHMFIRPDLETDIKPLIQP